MSFYLWSWGQMFTMVAVVALMIGEIAAAGEG